MSDPNVGPDHILHQEDVEDVVADQLDGGVSDANEAIADLAAITGGESPTEAEHNAVRTAVNDILAALRKSGIIPES